MSIKRRNTKIPNVSQNIELVAKKLEQQILLEIVNSFIIHCEGVVITGSHVTIAVKS